MFTERKIDEDKVGFWMVNLMRRRQSSILDGASVGVTHGLTEGAFEAQELADDSHSTINQGKVGLIDSHGLAEGIFEVKVSENSTNEEGKVGWRRSEQKARRKEETPEKPEKNVVEVS